MARDYEDQRYVCVSDELTSDSESSDTLFKDQRDITNAAIELMRDMVISDARTASLTEKASDWLSYIARMLACRRPSEPDAKDFSRAFNLLVFYAEHICEKRHIDAYNMIWRQRALNLLTALQAINLDWKEEDPSFKEWISVKKSECLTELGRRRSDAGMIQDSQVLNGAENGNGCNHESEDENGDVTDERSQAAHAVKLFREELLTLQVFFMGPDTHIHFNIFQVVLINVLRVGFCFISASYFALFQCVLIGFVMQFFYATYGFQKGDIAGDPATAACLFLLLPFALLWAWIGGELWDFTQDAFGRVAYPKVRAYMLVTCISLTRQDRGDSSQCLTLHRVFIGIDAIFTYYPLALILLVGIAVFSTAACDEVGVLMGACLVLGTAGLVWTATVFLIFLVCRFYCDQYLSQGHHTLQLEHSLFLPEQANRGMTANFLIRILGSWIVDCNIVCGYMKRFQHMMGDHSLFFDFDHKLVEEQSSYLCPDEFLEDLVAYDGKLLSHKGVGNKIILMSGIAWLIFCGFVLFSGRIFADAAGHPHFNTSQAYWVVPQGLVLCLILMSGANGLNLAFPYLTGGAFAMHVGVVVVTVMTMFLSGINHEVDFNKSSSDGNLEGHMLGVITDVEDRKFFNNGIDARYSTPYPICYSRWGSRNNVTVMDLAIVSAYSYETHQDDFEVLVRRSFGPAAEVIYFDEYRDIPRVVAVRLPHSTTHEAFQSPTDGTIILGIKGTSTAADAYIDVGMFSQIQVLQVFNRFVPILQSLPSQVIGWLLNLRVTEDVDEMFFQKFNSTYTKLRSQYANSDFVFTGHSLGGGFATIFGSRLNVPTGTFSSPGNLYSKTRMDMRRMRIYTNVMGVMPDSDPVPRVDMRLDTVQRIQCRKADGSLEYKSCHSITKTTCELWRNCGDHKGRDFYPSCTQNAVGAGSLPWVNPSCLGRVYNSRGECVAALSEDDLGWE